MLHPPTKLLPLQASSADDLCDTLGLEPTLSPLSTIRPLPLTEASILANDLTTDASEPSTQPHPSIGLSWRFPHDPHHLPNLRLSSEARNEAPSPEFQLLGTLGEGGMGVVHLAKQTFLERDVAIKQVKPDRRTESSALALLREAVFTGHLEHPNIVPVHTLGQNAGQPLFVMKRIEGVSWHTLLYQKDHPHWKTVHETPLNYHLSIFLQICNAVAFAHSKGILHRDIKPDNVMIGSFGEVYLVDWGVSVRQGDPSLLPPKAVVGSPAYMAPEMLRDDLPPVSEATDIYLLGATLHEILVSQPRHIGDLLSSVLFAAMNSAPFAYPSHVPAELAEICNQATHSDPQKRFPSVHALRSALLTFQKHQASIEISQSARLRLNELRATLQDQASPPDPLHVQRLFFECRFGFEHALRSWPENREAQDGLQDALRRMCRFALQEKSLLFATSLFDALHDKPADLRTHLERLQDELRAEQEDAQKHRRRQNELDLTRAKSQRWLLFSATFGLTFVLLCAVLLAHLQGYKTLSVPFLLLVAASHLSLVGVILFFYRRIFFQNQINRQIFLALGIGAATILLHRALGWYLQASLELVLLGDGLFLSGLFLLSAKTVHRAFAWPSLFAGLAVPLGLFFPQHTILFAAFAVSFFSLYAFRVWLQDRHR